MDTRLANDSEEDNVSFVKVKEMQVNDENVICNFILVITYHNLNNNLHNGIFFYNIMLIVINKSIFL